MTTVVPCHEAIHLAHGELIELGRRAAERLARRGAHVNLPLTIVDGPAVAAAVTETVIDAYAKAGHPALQAIVAEMEKHAMVRLQELIHEQQTGRAAAQAPS